jgi:gamma-glutamylcyclotransferase
MEDLNLGQQALPPPPAEASSRDETEKEEAANTTIYFGYGSNLWLEQMHRQCPESKFIGLGLPRGYRWIINERGCANVIVSSSPEDPVYGIMYALHGQDESRLDRNEGVLRGAEERTIVRSLVYINENRITPSKPKEEYADRINCGIRDAVEHGMPRAYVDKYLRPFIPKK